ncbi:unnamed protein product [Symbiodinium necroappetens]|uniref:Uncharacterized protein n=1 Tax=Symbiodinium necroappetens TaxID=1628268 RepID=A0A812NFK5_9DINO|nr:unnamed protein product [Symbiodinium necroappetens]
MDKRLDATGVDLIFADNRVKPRGQNRIDFLQFESALELLAEKKGVAKADIRKDMVLQGGPKVAKSTSVPVIPANRKPKENLRQISQKRILSIIKRPANEPKGQETWRKDVNNKELWKVFGLDNAAGRTLKRIYSGTEVGAVSPVNAQRSLRRTPSAEMMMVGKAQSDGLVLGPKGAFSLEGYRLPTPVSYAS